MSSVRPWGRNFNPVQSLPKQVKLLDGQIAVSGSGAVIPTVRYAGVSASLQSTGVYRVNIGGYVDNVFLPSSVPKILSAVCTWQPSGTLRLDARPIVTNVSAGLTSTGSYVEFSMINSGTLVAAPGSGSLHYSIAVQNSTVGV